MDMKLLRGYLKKTGKNAVVLIQHICQKKHYLFPRYVDKDLRPYVSAPHSFEVTLTLNFKGQEYSASGISSRKKSAKEEAAIQLLLKMNMTPKDLDAMQESKCRRPFQVVSQNVGRMDGTVDSMSQPSKPDVIVTTPAAASGQCYVNLILLCEERGIPDPEYEDVKHECPAACKTFRVLCRVRPANCNPIEVIGESNNKKKARRIAAVLMLKKLKDFATGENSINSIQILSTQATGPEISSRNEPECADDSMSNVHHRFKEMTGPTILSIRDRDITAIMRVPIEILAAIAEEENLMVMYSHVPEQESDGLCRWFCEIIDLEETNGRPSSFMGEGDDEMNAQIAAAINALLFLREASPALSSSTAGADSTSGSSIDLF